MDNEASEPSEEEFNLKEWLYNQITGGVFESPIDVNIAKAKEIVLEPLEWHNQNVLPKKMKLCNTGHTLIVSAKWHQERPFISGGPLIGNYVFSQVHFHWGKDPMEGSEHSVDGVFHPLEMHAVFFKSSYLTQESSLKERDGIVVLAYLFKLQSVTNYKLEPLLESIQQLKRAHSFLKINPVKLDSLIGVFDSDYLLYWGTVTSGTATHFILWMISRAPIGISAEQVAAFRLLKDTTDFPLIRNFREPVPLNNRPFYHVNPSSSKIATLLPLHF